jgi:hypothetical protein
VIVRIGELYALDYMAQCESMQLKTFRDISALVRQRRVRLGWSQERLAKRAGPVVSGLSNWKKENGPCKQGWSFACWRPLA